jgi:hypothetical protein
MRAFCFVLGGLEMKMKNYSSRSELRRGVEDWRAAADESSNDSAAMRALLYVAAASAIALLAWVVYAVFPATH